MQRFDPPATETRRAGWSLRVPVPRRLGALARRTTPTNGWMPMDLDELDALLDARTEPLPLDAEPPTETICIPGYN